MTINCFKCGTELEPVFKDTRQPHDGLMFVSHGNYGSTIFDPRPTSAMFLQIIICDECIKRNIDQVLLGRRTDIVEYKYDKFNLEDEF